MQEVLPAALQIPVPTQATDRTSEAEESGTCDRRGEQETESKRAADLGGCKELGKGPHGLAVQLWQEEPGQAPWDSPSGCTGHSVTVISAPV